LGVATPREPGACQYPGWPHVGRLHGGGEAARDPVVIVTECRLAIRKGETMTVLKDFPTGTEDRINELAEKTAEYIREEAKRLLRSGALDPDDHADRPYWMPKLVVSVACESAARQWENNLDVEWIENRDNLRRF